MANRLTSSSTRTLIRESIRPCQHGCCIEWVSHNCHKAFDSIYVDPPHEFYVGLDPLVVIKTTPTNAAGAEENDVSPGQQQKRTPTAPTRHTHSFWFHCLEFFSVPGAVVSSNTKSC